MKYAKDNIMTTKNYFDNLLRKIKTENSGFGNKNNSQISNVTTQEFEDMDKHMDQ